MDIILGEGDKITVTSTKGRFGTYAVLECMNGDILNRTDVDGRDDNLICYKAGCGKKREWKYTMCNECLVKDTKARTSEQSSDSKQVGEN